MDKFPITPSGFQKMEQELKLRKTKTRPAIIKKIEEARAHGDLSENAEYHAAREEQSFNEGRILQLEDMKARAEVIEIKELTGKTVKFGAKVTLIDEDTEEEVWYQIVGEYEADITIKRISIVSPLARALIGKTVGDSTEVSTPKGIKSYEILTVKFVDE